MGGNCAREWREKVRGQDWGDGLTSTLEALLGVRVLPRGAGATRGVEQKTQRRKK